jgi:hypothetical protein
VLTSTGTTFVVANAGIVALTESGYGL